jgi:hypothetical protein
MASCRHSRTVRHKRAAVSNATAADTKNAPATNISSTSEEPPGQTRYDRNLSLCMSGADGCNYDAPHSNAIRLSQFLGQGQRFLTDSYPNVRVFVDLAASW